MNSPLLSFPSAVKVAWSTRYTVDCSLSDMDGTINFIFGNININVPFKDFIYDELSPDIALLGRTRTTMSY